MAQIIPVHRPIGAAANDAAAPGRGPGPFPETRQSTADRVRGAIDWSRAPHADVPRNVPANDVV
jgi:hypothetical protein